MNRIFIIGLALASTVTLAAAAIADEPTFTTDKIYRATLKMDYTKKPVMFSHKVHTSTTCTSCHEKEPMHFPVLDVKASMRCSVCHHPVNNKVDLKACGECHNTTDKKATNSYFKVIHDRDYYGHDGKGVSCIGCHAKVVQSRPEKKKALLGCSDSACHQKAE